MNKEIKKVLTNTLESIKKTLQSGEMLCASYAYDYEKSGNINSYNEFVRRWNNFSDNAKVQIVNYFYSFNNYEMLKKLKNLDNLSRIQQIIREFIKNKYSNKEVEENKQKIKVK